MRGSIRQGNPPVFEETGPGHTRTVYELKRIIYRGTSRYQSIDVVETFDYGRMLLLDGCAMFSERDEANYHEMITHVPLLLHPSPRRVLVIGGGDGGTVREIVKHTVVEKVDLVEIDEQVINVCREYLPFVSGSLDDPRVTVHYRDGIEYVASLDPGSYQIILIDSSDPIGPAEGLFTADFYRACYKALTPDGIIVAQAESPYVYPDVLKQIGEIFNSIFTATYPYRVSIPTYPSGQIYFMLGSRRVINVAPGDKTYANEFFREHKLRYFERWMVGDR